MTVASEDRPKMSAWQTVAVSLSYSVIVLFAILMLASVQQRSSGGVAFDVWHLNLIASERALATLPDKIKSSWDNRNKAIDSSVFADQCITLYKEDGSYKPSVDSGMINNAKEALRAGKKAEEFQGEMFCLMRSYFVLKYDKEYYSRQAQYYEKESNSLENIMKEVLEQHKTLIKGRDEFLALKQFEETHSWISWLVIGMPYNLLVLIMAMFMGALGGMVRLLREYGETDHPNPIPGDYFFVPLIGMVVAIGGYVFARTGLLLLSTGKEEASLSPFMIALVGLISGLLARDMIDTIAAWGRTVVSDRRNAEAGKPHQRKGGNGTGNGTGGGKKPEATAAPQDVSNKENG